MKFLTAAAIFLVAGSAAAQQPIDRTISSTPEGSVEISNLAGRVRITGWNRPQIQITGTLGRGSERLAVEGSGTDTRIRVVIPRNARDVEGSDLDIRVPAGKDVRVNTTSADIIIEGVTGSVESRATSGNINVGGNPGQVNVQSTSGDVAVGVSTSRIQASSTSGDVRVSGSVSRNVAAQTVSGDLEIDATAPEVTVRSVSGDQVINGVGERVTAATVSGASTIRAGKIQYGSIETVSGELQIVSDLQPDGTLDVRSHSGDVRLSFPAGIAGEFDVSTFSGDIDNRLGGTAEGRGGSGPGRTLDLTVGNGGPVVTVKTFSGTVELLEN